jgi:hypothetical protein
MGGENVKNRVHAGRVSAILILCAGMLAAGCKSAPDLTRDQATSLIEASYAQAAPVPITVVVNDLGMRQGIAAKYWTGVKKYPNGYWADFKLTDDGKKLVKLTGGGDAITWRPDGPNDLHYAVIMTTVSASRLKATGIGDVEDNAGGKVVEFTEAEDLSGLPDALQNIARNSGNTLTTQRQANFVLQNGAWALQSVQ